MSTKKKATKADPKSGPDDRESNAAPPPLDAAKQTLIGASQLKLWCTGSDVRVQRVGDTVRAEDGELVTVSMAEGAAVVLVMATPRLRMLYLGGAALEQVDRVRAALNEQLSDAIEIVRV